MYYTNNYRLRKNAIVRVVRGVLSDCTVLYQISKIVVTFVRKFIEIYLNRISLEYV